jgi:predicted dehydrogenase
MHAWGYGSAARRLDEVTLTGVWDRESERMGRFASDFETSAAGSAEELLEGCDAVVVCSENTRHAEDVEAACRAGRAVLCEKPLVTSAEEKERLFAAADAGGVQVMTAFPCRFSPAFKRLKERVDGGDVGRIVGICATNRGRCPGGWFVKKELSGGGAMIDHTVHVADLLRVLLGAEPETVQAMTGNNVHGQEWEDTAMLTLGFPGGVFATLDSSWSRPKSYKTWGDVTMNVVGDKGVLELDMFSQALDAYSDEPPRHAVAPFGSDLDELLLADFVRCAQEGSPPSVTKEDGWKAVRVALAGYASARSGQPESPAL